MWNSRFVVSVLCGLKVYEVVTIVFEQRCNENYGREGKIEFSILGRFSEKETYSYTSMISTTRPAIISRISNI